MKKKLSNLQKDLITTSAASSRTIIPGIKWKLKHKIGTPICSALDTLHPIWVFSDYVSITKDLPNSTADEISENYEIVDVVTNLPFVRFTNKEWEKKRKYLIDSDIYARPISEVLDEFWKKHMIPIQDPNKLRVERNLPQ